MKNWRNVLTVVEVIIILTCIIVLITYFASKKEKESDNISSSVKDKNGIISQGYALEYLNKYVDEILLSGYINEKSEKYVEKEYDLVTPNIFNNLNENDKLYLSLSYLTNAKMPLSKENVLSKYKEYFNSEEYKDTNVTGCSSYSYDEANDKYTITSSCSAASLDKIMIYKQSYERDNTSGLATIYVGIKSSNGIYKNIEKTALYETDNIEDFTINEDNYKDFSEYQITFKEKDDLLYYFFSIEKIN